MIKKIFFGFGRFLHIFSKIEEHCKKITCVVYSGYCSSKFKSFGRNVVIKPFMKGLKGEKFISIGNDS